MSKVTLKVSGSRGEMFYRPQDTTLLSMMRVIRQHVGKVSAWEIHTSNIGFPSVYDTAANTMPRSMGDQFADYLRDIS